MKRILLLFFVASLLAIKGNGQSPQIVIGTTSLTETLLFGDTAVVSLVIHNTGNRDLNYELSVTGSVVEFEKEIYADWTLPENQDQIYPGTFITRKDQQGIFNIALEAGYSYDPSPENTEWAYGRTADLDPGDYQIWVDAVDGYPVQMVNRYTSMHMINEDMYFDIYWHKWTAVGLGGGFAYTRTEIPQWVRLTDVTGSVVATQTDTVKLVFDARVENSLLRRAQLHIMSDDPDDPDVVVELVLNIEGDPEAVLPVTSLDFGDIFTGTSVSGSVNLWNIGVGTLAVTDITNDNSAFTVTMNATDVMAGDKQAVSVEFSPSAEEVYEDTIIISTDDVLNPTLEIILSGTGVGVPAVNVTPTSITELVTYGEGVEYGDMDTVLLIISNPGDNDLEWMAYAQAAGAERVFFEKENYADYTLAENQDRITPDVWITRQDQEGIYNAAVEESYSDNSPLGTLWYNGRTGDASPWDYQPGIRNVFGGLGFLPGNTLSMYLPDTDIYYDVSFLTWTNYGKGGGFSYERVEAVNWLMLSDYNSTVASGDADTVLVLFNPSDYKASYDAEIVIRTNLPGADIIVPVTYTVSGPPEIDVSVGDIDFGNVFIGASVERNFTVQCWGADALDVSAINNDSAAYVVSQTSFVLPPNESLELTVTFTPTAEQLYPDTLEIVSNANTNPVYQIVLNGAGLLPPVISTDPEGFIDTLVSGDVTTDTLNIYNTGDNDLNWELIMTMADTPPVTFTKEDWANPALPVNQDRIADNVWITRGSDQALINAALETEYDWDTSPAGTEWYFGYTRDAGPGDYVAGIAVAHGGGLGSLPGQVMSLHLVGTDRYFDVYFHEWTGGGNGGGFSYTRVEVCRWLTASSYSGSIVPGNNSTVFLNVDAGELVAGIYNGEVHVMNNAPVNGDLAVPVDLTVTGEPQIELGNMSLEFGEVLIGYPVSKGLLINNTGTDVVNVTSVSGQSGLFMADGLPLSVPAMGSLAVEIQFAPTATGLVEDTLLIASDDPINPELELPVSGTGVELPEISLIPEEIVVNLFTDSVYHGEMYIENTGASDLRWVINLPDREIESVLDNLNANYTDILDLIPSRYDFSYDGDDYEINDGGDDMYDGANMLSTDLSGSDIRYSDNVIREGFNYFGPGSRYFTRHLAGLFVMVADLNGVGSFEINGNNGADGGGSYDGSILEKQIGTTHYTAFIKRVYGTSDPSINHMIIIKTSPGADHEYSTNTNDDYHRVFGLENSSRLYYLLYAGASGLYIDDTEAEAIMTQLLSSVEESWIIFDPMIDTAAAGEIDTVMYTLDATGLDEGVYEDEVFIMSNDPLTPEIMVPVILQYGGILTVNPIADVFEDEGFGTWNYDISDVFQDAQGDPLSYIVISDHEAVVTVAVDGTDLEVTEAGIGTSLITVRAGDAYGNKAYADFNFDVNGFITVANPLTDLVLQEGFNTHDVSIANVFSDPDGDALVYSADNDDHNVVTVTLAGTTLTVHEAGIGSTTVTVTASDGANDQISDGFLVTVEEGEGILLRDDQLEITLYPNPTTGILNIKCSNPLENEMRISLFDMTGRLMLTKESFSQGLIESMDLGGLDAGIYTIRIKTGDSEFQANIMRE